MPDLLRFPERAALQDASERADALDTHQSWVVEAPAGSGKTGLLIQRYLKLLADQSVTAPEQVLAITFTTKATAEMRERVLAQLQSAAGHTRPANSFDRTTRTLAEKVLVRDRELGWSLLNQPDRLKIRTIDAVCSEIANSLPILSGSGGRRKPVDDAAALYALAAGRTFLELGGPNWELHKALSTMLLHRDGNLSECERLLAEMLALRDQWGKLIPLGPGQFDDAWLDAHVLPKLERALEHAICAALTHLADTIPAGVLTQLTTAAADMAILDGHNGKTSPILVCTGRRDSPGSTVEDLEHWKALTGLLITPTTRTWRKVFQRHRVGFEAGQFEQDQLKQIVHTLEDNDDLLVALCKLRTLPPARYPEEQWAFARHLFRVLNRALAELQLVFAARGECDFTEIALAARTALVANDGTHDLEAALGVRLQHILVDEMQDTSSSQYELIEHLTRTWDGHSQTVFLVGDPKQSIYLFRQARVERFTRTLQSCQLGELPLGDLHLTDNFRSQPGLLDDFNTDFARIFPACLRPLHPEEVPYVQAFSARDDSFEPEPARKRLRRSKPQLNYSLFGDQWDDLDDAGNGIALAASSPVVSRIWHTCVLPYETDTAKKARETRAQRLVDAEEICRIVSDWRSRPLPLGRTSEWKIAVLCRSRNHLDEIVPALKAATIPFRAVDIDPLKDRPEVRDLFALTRALLHPADRVAWFAILRAPWCGLSLTDLHTLSGADDSAWAERSVLQVVAERGHLLPDDACQRLARIWPALNAAVQARARLPWAPIIQRTWRTIGGDSYLNAAELANATRYLQLLSQMDAEMEQASNTFDLPLLERRLDRLYAAPSLEAGAVDLLTIHKAKGLEWDVVIVPALERRAPHTRNRLLTWVQLDSSDERSAHVLFAPIAGKGQDSHDLTKWIRGLDSAREAAERKRLFYVACTRAREELHLFAAPTRSAKNILKPAANSLLAAAWPAVASHFADADRSAAEPGKAFAMAASAETETPFEEMEESEAPPSEALGDGHDIEAVSAESQLNLRIANQTSPLQRLPLDFVPATRFLNEHPLHSGSRIGPPATPRFERPEGSLAARALGNAVHAFLEQVTLQIAADRTPAEVLAALPSWLPRITVALRSEGLQPAVVERLAQRVLAALENTLKDSTGVWLLSPHAGAATEYGLTAWDAHRSNIRIDRIFEGGPVPFSLGSDHLWVVDYKTTTHGTQGLEDFLHEERAKYTPQLEAYASVLAGMPNQPTICLGLYYPLLARLIWWPSGRKD